MYSLIHISFKVKFSHIKFSFISHVSCQILYNVSHSYLIQILIQANVRILFAQDLDLSIQISFKKIYTTLWSFNAKMLIQRLATLKVYLILTLLYYTPKKRKNIVIICAIFRIFKQSQ